MYLQPTFETPDGVEIEAVIAVYGNRREFEWKIEEVYVDGILATDPKFKDWIETNRKDHIDDLITDQD